MEIIPGLKINETDGKIALNVENPKTSLIVDIACSTLLYPITAALGAIAAICYLFQAHQHDQKAAIYVKDNGITDQKEITKREITKLAFEIRRENAYHNSLRCLAFVLPLIGAYYSSKDTAEELTTRLQSRITQYNNTILANSELRPIE